MFSTRGTVKIYISLGIFSNFLIFCSPRIKGSNRQLWNRQLTGSGGGGRHERMSRRSIGMSHLTARDRPKYGEIESGICAAMWPCAYNRLPKRLKRCPRCTHQLLMCFYIARSIFHWSGHWLRNETCLLIQLASHAGCTCYHLQFYFLEYIFIACSRFFMQLKLVLRSRHETLRQCWLNVVLASKTVGHHSINIVAQLPAVTCVQMYHQKFYFFSYRAFFIASRILISHDKKVKESSGFVFCPLDNTVLFKGDLSLLI